MKKLIIAVIVALALVLIPVTSAFAATSQAVTITATPSYISISNSPSSKAFGSVAVSTAYWSKGSAPTFPLDDDECNFTVTNDGSVAVNINVTGSNFTGGVGWTLAGTPAQNTVTLKAGKSGDANEPAMVTLTTSPQGFISSLAAAGAKKWEIKMETPTSYTDGVEKSGSVTLTAAAA